MLFLLVGIDTEGDNQWDAAARANQTFANIHALRDLHAVFVRRHVKPTYLVTYPVVSAPRSADVLRSRREEGGCEIGAHPPACPPSRPPAFSGIELAEVLGIHLLQVFLQLVRLFRHLRGGAGELQLPMVGAQTARRHVAHPH